MTKAEIKKAVYWEANYWRRAFGRFAREQYNLALSKTADKMTYQFKMNNYHDWARMCRAIEYMRDGLLKQLI